MRKSVLLLLAVSFPLAAPAVAAAQAVRSPTFQKVLDCRAIGDSAQRLACFDGSVAALDSAEAKHDVAIVDREQMNKTRKQLFGFSLPSLEIFGDHKKGKEREDAQSEEVQEITEKMVSVQHGPDGYVVTLEDGARWAQTDQKPLGRSPKAGQNVTIRRAALGSYKLFFEGSPAVRAKRMN